MARRSDLAGLLFVLTSIRMNTRRASDACQRSNPRMPTRRAEQTCLGTCERAPGKPASQNSDSLSFSLEMAMRLVWTRTDGSSSNSSSGRTSRAIQGKQGNPTKQMEARPRRAQHVVPTQGWVFERSRDSSHGLLVCYRPLATPRPQAWSESRERRRRFTKKLREDPHRSCKALAQAPALRYTSSTHSLAEQTRRAQAPLHEQPWTPT